MDRRNIIKSDNKDTYEIKKIILQLNQNDIVIYELIYKIFFIIIIHMFISIFHIYFSYVILLSNKTY
mgnify:FL=1